MKLNPLVWLHLRLTSSPHMTFLVPIGVAAVVLIASSSTISAANVRDRMQMTSNWLAIVTIAQGLILFMLAPASIHKAVLRDAQTGMLESHRISPLPSRTIAFGYLIGPAVQSLLLFAALLPFSLYFLARISIGGLSGTVLLAWWVSLASVLALALMNAAIVLLSAISSGGRGNILAVSLLGSAMGGFLVVRLAPGVALIAGVMSGNVLYSNLLGRASSADPTTISVSMLLQFLLAVLCFIAASRKIRTPNEVAFTLPLGFCVLVVIGAALLLGIQLGKTFAWIAGGPGDQGEQVVGSAFIFYLFGLIPIIAAARTRTAEFHQAAVTGARAPRPLTRLDAIAPLVGLLAFGVAVGCARIRWVDMFFVPYAFAWGPNLLIALAFLIGAWIDYQIGLGVALRNWRVGRGLLYSLILSKGVPPLIDVVRWMFSDEIRQHLPPDLFYAAGSPIGTICIAHRDFKVAAIGLGVQIGLAVLATVFAGMSQIQALRADYVGPPIFKPNETVDAAPA